MSGVTLTSVPSVLTITKGKPWLDQALPTPPTAARTFVAGDEVVAAVEVYRQGVLWPGATLIARIDTARRVPVRFQRTPRRPGQRTEQRGGRLHHQYGKTARRALRAPGGTL